MSDKLFTDHIGNPRNFGEIKDADMFAQSPHAMDGDLVQIFIRLGKGMKIEDIKFRTFGCSMCIGASSYLTELVKGKTLKAARKVTLEDLAPVFPDKPAQLLHCHDLALKLLHSMIDKELKK
jgi:nitrogen fixation NifU-like protein